LVIYRDISHIDEQLTPFFNNINYSILKSNNDI